MLSEATVEVTVREEAGPKPAPVPCRITVLNASGALVTTGAASDRPARGPARGDLHGRRHGPLRPAGGRVHDPRRPRVRVRHRLGPRLAQARRHGPQGHSPIRREVPTPGYVACDTHVHTLTHSGHGDATDVERVVTLAGEGVELPVATDHNKQVDYHAAAVKAGRARRTSPRSSATR